MVEPYIRENAGIFFSLRKWGNIWLVAIAAPAKFELNPSE